MAPDRESCWVGLAMAVFRPGTALLAGTRSAGAEHVPRSGGALLVLNHVSNLDPFYDTVFVRARGRNPHSFAKHTLWGHPVVGHAMAGSNQIPVERGSREAGRSLRTGLRLLREGRIVLTYPEGTITRDPDWWPMTAHTGVARLALDLLGSDIPVLPVARWGTQAILDDHDRRFHPLPRHTVAYRVGAPVDLSGYRGRPVSRALLQEVTDRLMREVAGLLADLRGAPAPAEFCPRPRSTPPAPTTGG